MEHCEEEKIIWPFLLQLAVVIFLPLHIWWGNTPTNVLNSGPWWKLLETVGICGTAILFFAGIPVGIIGLKYARRTNKLCIPTRVFSIVNISCGAILWLILLAALCAVVFFGANH